MQSLNYHVYCGREKLASFKHAEDAAMYVGTVGRNAAVVYRVYHRNSSRLVWTEGHEAQSAAENFDSAARLMFKRVVALNVREIERATDERVDAAQKGGVA